MEVVARSPMLSHESHIGGNTSDLYLVEAHPGSISSVETPPVQSKLLNVMESERSIRSNSSKLGAHGSKDSIKSQKVRRSSWVLGPLRHNENETLDLQLDTLRVDLHAPWRRHILDQLRRRDQCLCVYSDMTKKNPCIAEEDAYKAEGALEALRRQLEDYRKKNQRKFRFLVAGFVLAVLGLIALIVALSVVLTSLGLEGVCSHKYVIKNQGDLANFLDEGCVSVDQLVLRGFVGNATIPRVQSVANLTIINSTYEDGVDTYLTFPDLITVNRSMRVVNNTGLAELHMPKLAVVAGELLFSVAPMLINLTFPSLTRMGTFTAYTNCSFYELLFPALTTVDNQIEITQCMIGTLSAPRLTDIKHFTMVHIDPFIRAKRFQQQPQAIFSPLNTFADIDLPSGLDFLAGNGVVKIDLPLLGSAESISFSRVVGLEGLALPRLKTLGRLELNLVSFDCSADSCGASDRPQLDLPILSTLTRLDIQYCSELHNVTLPGLISVKEVSLVANANMSSFTLNFIAAAAAPFSMYDPRVVGWIRIMLNSRLSYINLGQLLGSTEGISIFNDDTLEEFIAPYLREVSSLAIADTSRLRNLTFPSLEKGALVIANNLNLQYIEAPKYKGGSTLVIVRNSKLALINVPELHNISGSYGMSEVYWLVSSLLKNTETNEWEGMLLIDRNPSLYHVALPNLVEVTMCVFMRQPRMFTPTLPVLTTNLVFMIIGNRDNTEPKNETVLPVPVELNLPMLANNTKMIIYNTLFTRLSVQALKYNDLFVVAGNEQLKTIEAPSLKWGAADPAHVCINNNAVLCTPTNIAAGFAKNTTATDKDRSCSINQNVNAEDAMKNNGSSPLTPEVSCVPQNQTTAPCCDRAANAVPNTGCVPDSGLICSFMLLYLAPTPDRA